MNKPLDGPFDLFVIGGGINGAGIARDAAGRGLKVALCDMGDFGGGTSSASTKLIHGGLRYLEQYKFQLVRAALAEREVLLRMAPHIIWPLRFVLPVTQTMRPPWMIQAGLWLYDHLGGPTRLPRSKAMALASTPAGAALRADIRRGFIYSDCWVDDARLVILNLRAAADLGATILPRTRCVAAHRDGSLWQVETTSQGGVIRKRFHARILVNAAGPWVKQVADEVAGGASSGNIQLVKGSHIVVPRLYQGEHAYLLQNDDKRVVFLIPYETDFTLIGTTDIELQHMPERPAISPQEIEYLCQAASSYLSAPVRPSQVVWSYAGVRPLYDDGSTNPSELTRDYVLELNHENGKAPLLSVFGGKITTYRRLAEQALQKLRPYLPGLKPPWTASKPLPGGDLPGADLAAFLRQLQRAYPRLPPAYLAALARRHGGQSATILGRSQAMSDLGCDFGGGLTAREVDYLVTHEWAMDGEDVLWRRTKCGLHMNDAQKMALNNYVSEAISKNLASFAH